MKLNALNFGVATAVAFAIVWIICFIFVWMLPTFSMSLFSDMMHSSDMNMQWHFGLYSFIVGLIAWSLCGGFTAWLIAVVYNKLT